MPQEFLRLAVYVLIDEASGGRDLAVASAMPSWGDWNDDRIRRSVCVMSEPGEEPRPKPDPVAFLSNWTTYDAPFATKLRMAASNTLIKLRRRQACCGNNGQPG